MAYSARIAVVNEVTRIRTWYENRSKYGVIAWVPIASESLDAPPSSNICVRAAIAHGGYYTSPANMDAIDTAQRIIEPMPSAPSASKQPADYRYPFPSASYYNASHSFTMGCITYYPNLPFPERRPT